MAKFSGWLMVSDLDKTFFGEGTEIPEKNLEAVKYFTDNGGLFTLATGRGIVASKIIAKDIPVNAPALLFNGAVLYDLKKEKLIDAKGITDENIKGLLKDIMKKFPDVMLAVFKDEDMYCVSDAYIEQAIPLLKMNPIRCSVDEVSLPWYKVLCIQENGVLVNLNKYLLSLGLETVDYVRSMDVLLEIIGKDIDKGFGLRNLARILNIPMAHTVAIGDYFNDEPMLKCAGRVFLPENAAEELKGYGTVVCNHKEGAVADAIKILDEELR